MAALSRLGCYSWLRFKSKTAETKVDSLSHRLRELALHISFFFLFLTFYVEFAVVVMIHHMKRMLLMLEMLFLFIGVIKYSLAWSSGKILLDIIHTFLHVNRSQI